MDDIFLSYAREDRPRVTPLADALAAHGWGVFWDNDIPVGSTWDEHIEQRLDAARCVVVVWTEASVKSNWVRAEAGAGHEQRKLVPVYLDDLRPPLIFRGIQGATLADWRGETGHPQYRRVLDAVKKLAGAPREESRGADAPSKPSGAPTREPGFPVPEMVDILAGKFEMGDLSGNGFDNERPAHPVCIERPFRLGKCPVTFGEYDAFAEDSARGKMDDSGWGRGRHPVINVSWDDAVAYAEWLSAKTDDRYRLPTEAEWEYAARAGTRTDYSFGDDQAALGKYAWFGQACTDEVGLLLPNLWGLFDIHGNVREWVQDTWHRSYNRAPDDGSAWVSGKAGRVLRGGSWTNGPDNVRSAIRFRDHPDKRGFNVGFRLAQDV